MRLAEFVTAALVLTGCFGASASRADTILDFTAKGYWVSDGYNNLAYGGTANMSLVGASSGGTIGYRQFFVFDLAGVTDPIGSAILTVGNFSYNSADASETWTLYDASTSLVPTLTGGVGVTGRHDVYADLGSGNAYGQRTLTSATNGTNVPVTLDTAAFVNDINAARGGLFAIGGALTSLAPGYNQTAFGFFAQGATLTLAATPVPEPSSMAVLLAPTLLALMRRSRLSR